MMNDIAFLKRFNELTERDLFMDLHIHTSWTDGSCKTNEIIEEAEVLGLKRIAFTEHVRRESTYYSKFFKEVDAARKKEDMEILIGVETKVRNLEGELDVGNSDFEKAEIVLASVHRIPHKGDFVSPSFFPKNELFAIEKDLALAIIKCEEADVLSHPAGMSLAFYKEFPERYWEEIVGTISQTNMAFEINFRYLLENTRKGLIPLLKRYNPYVSMGSDVHALSDLGKCCEFMREII